MYWKSPSANSDETSSKVFISVLKRFVQKSKKETKKFCNWASLFVKKERFTIGLLNACWHKLQSNNIIRSITQERKKKKLEMSRKKKLFGNYWNRYCACEARMQIEIMSWGWLFVRNLMRVAHGIAHFLELSSLDKWTIKMEICKTSDE